MRRSLSIKQFRQRKERKEEKESDLRRTLHGQVARAVKDNQPYAVVALIPQLLPGEEVGDFVRQAGEHLSEFVRGEDCAGLIADGVLAVGLSEADGASAQVAAHRVKTDLGLRTQHLRNTIWESGYACLPEDGLTADQLVGAAIEAARTHRRAFTTAW
jgi:hypothetical protein